MRRDLLLPILLFSFSYSLAGQADELNGQPLLPKVADSKERSPIVTNPWVQLAGLTASDAVSNDLLGSSVAVSGNTVVVGAPGCHECGMVGTAYVYVESASGWTTGTQTAKLTASDGTANNQFGFAVAISGNTVVIGAFEDNHYRGAVYVFVEPSSGWVDMTETAKLTASDFRGGKLLGRSVAISGNTVVAGAPAATVGANKKQGSAYLYVEPPGGWASMTQTAKLTASDGAASDDFGRSVGIDGNTVVVGAPYAAIGTNPAQGASYVFAEPEGGWGDMTQTAKLTASDGAPGNRLGNFVAISGSAVVAGAPLATVSHFQQGAAYVFVMSASGWGDMTQTGKLTSSDGVAHGYFGRSVAISGTHAVVGAPNQTVGSFTGQGAVYEFAEPDSGWADTTETAQLNVANATSNDFVGCRVGIDGSTVVAGALGWRSNGVAKEGAAFVFSESQ